MFPIILAGLIGLGFVGLIASNSNSDDDAAPEEELPPEEGGEEEVNILQPDGDAELQGTDRADFLDLSGPEYDTSDLGDLQHVSLGDGDDTVFADRDLGGIALEGGAGADLFDVPHAGAIYGGEGDDTINVGVSTAVDGGAGDDQIFVDLRDTLLVAAPPLTLGGAGDDIMGAAVDVLSLSSDFSEVHLNGGEGVDTYDLTLQVKGSFYEGSVMTDPQDVMTGITISGWDVSNEPLIIDLQYDLGAEGRALEDLEFVRNTASSAGPNDYYLHLMLAGTETMGAATVSIRLLDVIGLPTVDAVTLRSSLPIAA